MFLKEKNVRENEKNVYHSLKDWQENLETNHGTFPKNDKFEKIHVQICLKLS